MKTNLDFYKKQIIVKGYEQSIIKSFSYDKGKRKLENDNLSEVNFFNQKQFNQEKNFNNSKYFNQKSKQKTELKYEHQSKNKINKCSNNTYFNQNYGSNINNLNTCYFFDNKKNNLKNNNNSENDFFLLADTNSFNTANNKIKNNLFNELPSEGFTQVLEANICKDQKNKQMNQKQENILENNLEEGCRKDSFNFNDSDIDAIFNDKIEQHFDKTTDFTSNLDKSLNNCSNYNFLNSINCFNNDFPSKKNKFNSSENNKPYNHDLSNLLGSDADDIENICDSKKKLSKLNFDNPFYDSSKDNNLNDIYPQTDISEWKEHKSWDQEVDDTNLKIFSYNSFRPFQREIINASMENRDIFVCMPTGGGKSLTYQIPAIIKYGVTLVIMPLLSLIQDQISELRGMEINVKFLSSQGDNVNDLLNDYNNYFKSKDINEHIKMIFLTPEKISKSQRTMELLSKLYNDNLLERVVVDECHCVCNWGQEFRPDYLNLKVLKKKFPKLPILALTATATNQVKAYVINKLGMKNPVIFRGSFNRTNLYMEIRNKGKDVIQDIAMYIKNKHMTHSGIIYCATKKHCEDVFNTLYYNYGFKCGYYHASLKEDRRNEVQEKWKNGDINIIIATIAFGMGINKSDVRFVIHHSMPRSFEGYYQEIGRAGRDGEKSDCILYYSPQDRKIQEFLMKNNQKNDYSSNLRNITEMVDFCEEKLECRRCLTLAYFGEEFDRRNCNKMCDNCNKAFCQIENKDVTEESIIILTTIQNAHLSGKDITLVYLVDYLKGKGKGKKTKIINDYNSGKLIKYKDNELKKIIRKLIIQYYIDEKLIKTNQNVYTVIQLGKIGIDYLNQNSSIRKKIYVSFLSSDINKSLTEEIENEKDYSFSNNSDEFEIQSKKQKIEKNNQINLENIYGYNNKEQFEELFSKLKKRRKEIYDEECKKQSNNSLINIGQKLSLEMIFTDNGLKELCRKLPEKAEDLDKKFIYGIGMVNLKKYGVKFLDIILEHILFHKIDKSKKYINFSVPYEYSNKKIENKEESLEIYNSNRRDKNIEQEIKNFPENYKFSLSKSIINEEHNYNIPFIHKNSKNLNEKAFVNDIKNYSLKEDDVHGYSNEKNNKEESTYNNSKIGIKNFEDNFNDLDYDNYFNFDNDFFENNYNNKFEDNLEEQSKDSKKEKYDFIQSAIKIAQKEKKKRQKVYFEDNKLMDDDFYGKNKKKGANQANYFAKRNLYSKFNKYKKKK